MNRLWREEEGQATTEYILLLAIIVGMLVTLLKKLIAPAYSKLLLAMSNQIEKKIFGVDLHYFPIRP